MKSASVQIERLRLLATQAEASSTAPAEYRVIWRELSHGDCKIVDHYSTDERSYLLLRRRELVTRRASGLSERRIGVLKQVLLAQAQKAVAFELGLAPSTIAMMSKQCLEHLGLSCRPSKAPLLLTMIAHGCGVSEPTAHCRKTEFIQEGSSYLVVSASRPERAVENLLSPAEYAVTRLLLDGCSYAEIAYLRRTSVRTVANQLAAAFRRLRVSGRSELCRRLAVLHDRP